MRRIFRARDYEPDADRDLGDELDAHLELMVEDLVAEGVAEEEARARAHRALSRGKGAHATVAPQARRNLRRRSFLTRMDAFSRDLRYAIRRMAQSPGFTAIALLSMALGIGANTAIFSLAEAVLIRDMPFVRPQELVDLYTEVPGNPYSFSSYLDYLDLRSRSGEVFSEVGAVNLSLGQIEQDGRLVSVMGELVTGTYFPLLEIEASLGRTLLPEDDVSQGAHYVVMLGYAYWQSAFDGDPDVLGRTIRINGDPYEIIGVAPQEYRGSVRGIRGDFFVSIRMMNVLQGSDADQLADRDLPILLPKGRRRPGVSLEQVEVTLAGIAGGLRREYPEVWRQSRSFHAVPTANVAIHPSVDRIVIPAVFMAMGIVGLVLLIACANLASFLLTRATTRRREIAVRLALGASRGTLIRQLLIETVVLALMGGGAGLGVGLWILGLLPKLESSLPLPIDLDLRLNGAVLAFTGGATLLAGILFGLAPALQATRPDVAPTLRDESSGGGGPRRLRIRNLLVVGQVAASLVLLAVASLFLRSLQARGRVDPGFGHDPAAIVHVNLRGHSTPAEGRMVLGRIVEEVSALPGVRDVGFADNIPLNSLRTWTLEVNVDGVEPPSGESGHEIDQCAVGPGFFRAIGIPLLRGRSFEPSDGPGGREVAIVNEVMAERFWPGEDPLGRVIHREDSGDLVVVGVVRSVKVRTLGEAPRPYIYLPYGQNFSSWPFLIARTSGGAGALLPEMTRIIREADPEAVLVNTLTMEDHLGALRLQDRMGALFSGIFAVLALILASIGLYGVVSHAVASRSREMGIRMSLGAGRRGIVMMMVGGGMKLVLVGGGLGLVLAVLVNRVLQGLLFGVAPLDPVTFLGVPALLLGIALLAAWLPARRAARVDPVKTLRTE